MRLLMGLGPCCPCSSPRCEVVIHLQAKAAPGIAAGNGVTDGAPAAAPADTRESPAEQPAADPFAFLPPPSANNAVHTMVTFSDGRIMRIANTQVNVPQHAPLLTRRGHRFGSLNGTSLVAFAWSSDRHLLNAGRAGGAPGTHRRRSRNTVSARTQWLPTHRPCQGDVGFA